MDRCPLCPAQVPDELMLGHVQREHLPRRIRKALAALLLVLVVLAVTIVMAVAGWEVGR